MPIAFRRAVPVLLLHRPVPLQMTKDGDVARLYAGRNWVRFQPE